MLNQDIFEFDVVHIQIITLGLLYRYKENAGKYVLKEPKIVERLIALK